VYEICQRLLDRYNNEGKEEFLSRIVTGDEMWVHHYEPESKRQSMEWKHLGLPTKKKFKWCINGCATNRKPSWKEYASLWTAGPSASKRKETVEK
jgi:hypothetical protein